jgi:cell division septation protein DedD
MGMMPPLDSRDLRALLVFFGGVLVLFGFFAAGAYVGRWPRQTARPSATAGARADAELYLVEVASFDAQDKANDTVQQLRRQYISVRAVYDSTDRLFHVYAGPYPADEANTVADELRQRGTQTVVVKPYAPKQTPAT